MNLHTVCVYGTLKRGMKNHALLEDSEFVGTDVTAGRFRMVDVGFPAIVPDEAGHPVAVEVYRVDRMTLARLFKLEGVPHMYQPVKTPLQTLGEAGIFIWQLDMEGGAPVEPNEEGILDWQPKPMLIDPATDEGRLYMVAYALAELQDPGRLGPGEMQALLQAIPALIDLYEATLPDAVPSRQQLQELLGTET